MSKNFSTPPPFRLRLLAPSIALIVATTMIPTAVRHPSLLYIDNGVNAADFINNVLLYMPLGIALGGTSLLRALLFGLCLSTAAETLQLGYVDRIPSFLDIASNTCGSVAGYLAATIWIRATGRNLKLLRVSRPVGAAAIVVATLGALMLVYHRPQSDFSNWDPAFHLAIGNEITGSRPWEGTVAKLQIYPFALPSQAVHQLASLAAESASANQTPAFPAGGLLPAAPGGFPSGRLLTPQQESAFYQALVKQNQLTVLLLMRPGNLEQAGNARVITYSQDWFHRNFTLGQIHDTLTFRLRTPDSGPNGANPALYSGPVLALNHTSFVAAVYDGRLSTLYVDGSQVAQSDLGARRPRLPKHVLAWLPQSIPVHQIELVAAEILFGGLFALGLFAVSGYPARLWLRLLAGAAAGAAIGVTIWTLGVSSPRMGIRILAECATAGLVVAASVESIQLNDPFKHQP